MGHGCDPVELTKGSDKVGSATQHDDDDRMMLVLGVSRHPTSVLLARLLTLYYLLTYAVTTLVLFAGPSVGLQCILS